MPKWLIVLIVVLAVLGGLILLGYWKFFGVSKAQKYERCAQTCEKAMINVSNVSACKMECEEVTGYTP